MSPGQYQGLLKALTAYYYPGEEPPEMKITDADRGSEHFVALIVALAGKGLRLEYDQPEVMQIAGKTDATPVFYIARVTR